MKIIIAGAGSVGRYLLERLVAEHHDIVVIDQNDELLVELSSEYDIQTVCGSASSLEILVKADAAAGDIFIAVTDSDETNLISCLLADSLNVETHKIARVKEIVTDASGLSERIATVFDHFINPDSEAVSLLLRLFEVPGAVELMEFGDGKVWVVGVVPGPKSSIIGRSLKELPRMYDMTQMLIVAIARGDQLIIPRGEDAVEAGDEIYVAAEANKVDSVFEILGRVRTPVRHVMIYGGGPLGKKLAKALGQRDIKVKLLDADSERCMRLAGELSNVLVLNGDATQQDLLIQEGVGEVDVFVGASEDDEENILAALLAKRLGAKSSAVIIRKNSYLNLVPAIGIDIVVSPPVAAASTILKFVRRGSISSVFSTRDDRAEVLESVASEGSKIVGKPLKDLKLPPGAIVAAILKDDCVTIPHGDRAIAPGEHVIFFANRSALPKLQKMLEVRRAMFVG